MITLSRNGEDLMTATGAVLIQASLTETSNGAKTATILVSDYDGKLLAKLSTATFPLRVDMSYAVSASGTQTYGRVQPWYVLRYRSGVRSVAMDLTDIVGVLGLDNRIRAYSGTASDIAVRAMDTAAGLGYEIKAEPAQRTNLVLHQCRISTLDFVMNRVLPRATTKDGRSGYRLYSLANKVLVSTPDYESVLISYTLPGVMDKARSAGISNAAERGAAGITACSHDPVQAQTSPVVYAGDLGLKTGSGAPQYLPLMSQLWSSHTGPNGSGDALAIVRSRVESGQMTAFSMDIKDPSKISLDVGTIVTGDFQTENESAPAWNGVWFVGEKRWTYADGMTMLGIRLYRNMLMAGTGAKGQALRAKAQAVASGATRTSLDPS